MHWCYIHNWNNPWGPCPQCPEVEIISTTSETSWKTPQDDLNQKILEALIRIENRLELMNYEITVMRENKGEK